MGEAAALPDQSAVSPDEAARRLSVSRDTVFRLIAEGELKSFKVGWLRRVSVREIERYIARKEREAA